MRDRAKFVFAGVALLLAFASPAAAASSVFAGLWSSTDYDGSHQTLVVSAGESPSVTFQDFYASACADHGDRSTHWVSAGSAMVDGDVLSVHFHRSGCGTFGIGSYDDEWYYDSGSDTLTDSAGITWYRTP